MRAAIVLAMIAACGGGHAAPPASPKPTPEKPTAPATTLPESADLAGPVKKVRVEGGADSVRTQIETMLAPAVGKPLDPDVVRAVVVRAIKVPGVADVAIQGVQLADGIELVVAVTPQPTLRRLTAIETGGKTIALGIGAIPNDSPLDPARIQTLASSLRERYVADGYFDAEVSWRREAVANGVNVTIEVAPGAAATIGSVAFHGNTVASPTLAALVTKLLVVGQPAVDDTLQTAATTIEAYYWDKGYANVRVRAPKAKGGKNALVFDVTEGPKFTISAVHIRGVPEAEHAKHLKLFGVKAGDLFNRTAIATGRQRVVDALGKPNAEALPLTKVDITKRTIDLTLEINPGTN